ncbi:hypothetical protein ASE92_20125 [Pedobacter sp. Leaf41]|uniref:hypothetical protein n=1 Tax=Pedobacter sp. Leaf41 TaxID=1736218 RepID=UPI000703B866|nr:hypothetical protein [Pedobacter sp. Leaf41]KQN37246.1 hypothetical protein ASE92_20125 [Pedobacter sp. Leaf41]
MAKLFIFGIGGTGSRIIKSLTFLLGCGIKSINDFEIVPIIIDPHKDNEDLKRTISILDYYQKIIEKVGSTSGFFSTKISTLQSLDADNKLSGTYSFNLKEVSNTKFKDYFSFNTLNDENKAFAELLFSGKSINANGKPIDLLDIPMDIGFVGNPNVGSVVLNQFKDSEEFKDFANNFNEGDRVFIISSIFGGTGAAGFPTVLKNIRNAVNIPGLANPGYLHNSSIGALTVMPYFNIEGDENSPIKKSDFIEKTKAALGYYQQNVNPQLNTMYYIGDSFNGRAYENDPGNGGQKNKAHFVELAGALSIIDFMNLPDDHLQTYNGTPVGSVFKEFSIKEDQPNLYFNHLNDIANSTLSKSLTQFVLLKKYLDEQLANSIENQVWSTDEPKIDNAFKSGQFFSSILKGFLNHFGEWLSELQTNTRGFSPFNLNSDLTTLVNGHELKKGWFGKGKITYNDYDMELAKLVKKNSFSSQEQKIISLFYQTTANVISAKYNF